MRNEMYIFEAKTLPNGFRFPDTYLNLLNIELPEIEPWWWLAPHKDSSLFWLETLKKQFPLRSLVPFAKDGGSDDVACFDGADTTGNPKVLIIHSFCDPGWEHRGDVANFQEWLDKALIETARFHEDTSD